MTLIRRHVAFALIATLPGLIPEFVFADPPAAPVAIVRVNDRQITTSDLETAYLIRGVSPENRASVRQSMLERLIEEALIADFLQRRKITPNAVLLANQLDELMTLIRRRGEDPDAFLVRLGLTREQLAEQLSLPLAWNEYVQELITADQMHEYFKVHQRELDGTQVRARHIILKVPREAEDAVWDEATARLLALRGEIQRGERSFEEASAAVSEGPSGKSGGDVGYFAYRGTMPPAFADAAFRLQRGELSVPVRTNVGVHLIEVTDERPGQLSLEDVRQTVVEHLADRLWEEHIARERKTARIHWSDPASAPAVR